MPSLSIITINLNNATGLRKTIESVVSQTSHDFEYIVIDGGSTDGSIEVIKEFKAKITFWISEPDNGIYHAMNKGIMVAKGEYCQFLNSGDWLTSSGVINIMLDTIPDCSIYYGNMLKQLPGGKVYRDSCGKGNISMISFYKGSLNHSPAIIKRSLFDKYGLYDETLKIVSDWKWFLIVIGLHNEKVNYTNQDFTCFDMEGISSSNSKLEKTERRLVLEELLPSSILKDYDTYFQSIEQTERLKKYRPLKSVLWFIERLLFKYEKWT